MYENQKDGELHLTQRLALVTTENSNVNMADCVGLRVLRGSAWKIRETMATDRGQAGTVTFYRRRKNAFVTVTWDDGGFVHVVYPGSNDLQVLDGRCLGRMWQLDMRCVFVRTNARSLAHESYIVHNTIFMCSSGYSFIHSFINT